MFFPGDRVRTVEDSVETRFNGRSYKSAKVNSIIYGNIVRKLRGGDDDLQYLVKWDTRLVKGRRDKSFVSKELASFSGDLLLVARNRSNIKKRAPSVHSPTPGRKVLSTFHK